MFVLAGTDKLLPVNRRLKTLAQKLQNMITPITSQLSGTTQIFNKLNKKGVYKYIFLYNCNNYAFTNCEPAVTYAGQNSHHKVDVSSLSGPI